MEELQRVKISVEEETKGNHHEINRLKTDLEKVEQQHEKEIREITFALNKAKKKYKDLSKEYGELVSYSYDSTPAI